MLVVAHNDQTSMKILNGAHQCIDTIESEDEMKAQESSSNKNNVFRIGWKDHHQCRSKDTHLSISKWLVGSSIMITWGFWKIPEVQAEGWEWIHTLIVKLEEPRMAYLVREWCKRHTTFLPTWEHHHGLYGIRSLNLKFTQKRAHHLIICPCKKIEHIFYSW